MPEQEKTLSWRLTIRAALILAAVGLGLLGIFNFDRIDCPVCWQDVAKHYFAFFGYFAAFGFAIGWTLPKLQVEAKGAALQWNTRQGFWEGSLGAGALITLAFAAMQLLT